VLIGLGAGLLAELGVHVPRLRPMEPLVSDGLAMPATPGDLWLRIDGADPGEVLHRTRALELSGFRIDDETHGFLHGESRDLSGYEDGTENPTDDAAVRVALAADGSSMLAVQRWVHDWSAFDGMTKEQQDHTFGRERVSNEELADAPDAAHVKRTAQEDFDPEAFVVRRSMPWSDDRGSGLVFLAFGATLDPFEALLRRMMGKDDGITDALFTFTRPIDGATFWIPPLDADGILSFP
jgi:putative iron-dependent peroxidase